jgi:four helix bundle protein
MEKNEFIEQMLQRNKDVMLRIIRLFQYLPKTDEAKIIGKQMLRSGTSFAANYRAVCRARSKAEFFSKLSIVIEELDETLFWMETLIDAKILPNTNLEDLMKEGSELLAVYSHARRNTK